MGTHEAEKERGRSEKKRANRRVYINKPREKTPKIIPAREEINPMDTGMRAGREEVRPYRRQGGA